MAIVRLAPRRRRVTRLERIRFHRDVAAVHRNRCQFHCERIVLARIGTRRCDLSENFASSFQKHVSLDRDILSKFSLEVLPATVFELNELTVLTVIVVPAGSVAAFKDEATTQAQTTEIAAMTFVCFIFWRVVNWVFNQVFRKVVRLLRWELLALAD